METVEFVETLRREGELFADTVARADPSTPVPTCPGWTVRDLAAHLGSVHRWAAGLVRERRTEAVRPDAPGPLADDALVPWLREGHGLLVEALESAPDDLSCWTFLPAASPLVFWTRRQAHETAVHRADAELALGLAPTTPPAGFAADGVDELLCDFYPRRATPDDSADAPRTVHVRATDVPDAAWTVPLGDPAAVRRSAEPPAAPDCVYEGTAADLYLALWNRRPLSELMIEGDPSVARRWRELFTP
ncbi:maleylpyruvate isomerase family mycothiol-dependent enzyme [Streptomyces albus]|uniref:maleylpyruvate isomerase family mycothiol-dependent enzyme n=1 Tax=Streptomyces albus TaxID=1888 RepID=UPI0006E30FA5|nr:maleylpyruvate isomerase family mycothiol-dependent enzyme [Streptomyces albus]